MRTAIVTGGGSGIGEAVARRLAADGHRVAVFDLSGSAADSVVSSLPTEAVGLTVDVTDRAAIDAGVAEVRDRLGRPSILINNAGLTTPSPFLSVSAEAWRQMLDINLTGTFHCCQAVLPDMVEEGWGRIVNISSSSVHSGAPGLAGYVAAKSGVVGLTKVLALEFGRHGITVNTVPPGFIDTPMLRRTVETGLFDVDQQIAATPVGRIGTASDVAHACAYLVSEGAGYVTGQIIGVNGGRNT